MLEAAILSATLQLQPVPVEAPSIVAALTHETVEIREDFAGQELILYGATRGLTIQDEIIVVLRGPGRDLRVMEKERTFGIWVNSAPLEIDDVPSYYAMASSLPLEHVATPEELEDAGIGLVTALEARLAETETSIPIEERQAYLDAIARAGDRNNVYAEAHRGVEILDGGLFRATMSLPPLTPVGDYVAEVHLLRDGRPIASKTTSLRVEKAGIERLLFEFAHNAPMIYGLFCVALAMLAGYLADLVFKRR